MSDEQSLIDRIVTKFLLDTCRPRELQLQDDDSEISFAAALCKATSRWRPLDYREANCIPLITGSVVEFYIQPMLQHVGDVDVMLHSNAKLAVPRGHPPPTQLPAKFHNYVQVVEIIDSHLPGYVYLVSRYLLTETTDGSNYNVIKYDSQLYLKNAVFTRQSKTKLVSHGPAVMGRSVVIRQKEMLMDFVFCIRCMSWLPQAADWPTRHRNYGWPDSATLDRVVSNGCDVVRAVHRQCRQHQWIGEHQWRLSFSRAEIVLINSWMPVQQIAYHMLRYFIKTEQLTDCADNSEAGTLSNYHVKTLMLWACEMESKNWWIGDMNLIRVCVELLRTLAVWLADMQCPHYFINNCNLIDNSYDVQTVTNQLMSINESWLSTWFINKYIRRCSQLCPSRVSRMMDDVTTSVKLQNAITAIVNCRENNALTEKRNASISAQHRIQRIFLEDNTDNCPDAWSYVCFMKELSKIDPRLVIYLRQVVFLHVARKLCESDLIDEFVDILATVLGHFLDIRRKSNRSCSLQSLFKAIKLMKVVANKSLSTMSLIEIELSKAYLYRALRCKYSDSDSIYCLANVYLAVLCYTTGQYQTAIDHCTLVTRSQDHSQCSSHVVQGEILPNTDNNIDNVLGLAVLYQHVRKAAMNDRQHHRQHVSVFTTELFAYYLHIRSISVATCLNFMQALSPDEFNRYGICISDSQQLFIGDVLLLLSVSRLLKFRRNPIWSKPQNTPMNASECSRADLVELLQKSAVEHLTTYRQLMARDFGSVVTIVTTDFEALYAYKRGDYQRCLQLFTQNMDPLLNAACVPFFQTFPQFIQLLDDDIVSLTALTLILKPVCRVKSSLNVNMSQLTLSLYLITQCQLKLRHSVTSLAQTLNYIKVAQRRHGLDWTMDHLVLKLTERKALAYVRIHVF